MDQQKRIVEVFDLLQSDDERSKYFIECIEKMDSGLKMELVKMGDKGWEGKSERDFLELYSVHHLEKFKKPFFVEWPARPLAELMEPSEAAVEVAKEPSTTVKHGGARQVGKKAKKKVKS